MARQAEYKGRTFEFPDTATDDDIMSFLANNAEQMIAQQQEVAPVEQEAQDVVLPEPPQDLTGQTEVEQPIQGSEWAPLPSAEGPSNWADTAQPSNVEKAGYRGDGSINYEDPRWRGMDAYSIASQTAWDDTKQMASDVWADLTANTRSQAPDEYTQQAQRNREDLVRPFREQAPTDRGQESMDVEALKAAYGDKPSMWDKVSPETLEENVPQAAEAGSTLLDAVYTDKAKFMAQGLSDAEAEKLAYEKAQRESLQFAAGVATAPVAGIGSLPARMALAGGVNTTAGAVADVAADKELDTGTMAEDFFWGSLGGLGGKAGKDVVKKGLGEGADNIKALASAPEQQLDDLAKQAQVKQSIAASTSSTKPLSEALEGTKTITANDLVDAKEVATTLQTLNKAGAKADITDILKTVKNEELRSILAKSAPIKSAMAAADDKVKSVVGQDVSELLGFGSAPTKKANREAIAEVAEAMTEQMAWSKESLEIVGNFKGATQQSFDKVFKSLERAQQLILDGRFAQAKRELAKTDNKKSAFRKSFGATAAEEIGRMKNELNTMVSIGKDTKGHAQPQNLLGKIQSLGVPTLAMYATNPLVGAGVSAGKGISRFAAGKVNAKKLADVERALGGKLKVDAEAERMLAEGADVGAVIGYLVSKLLRED